MNAMQVGGTQTSSPSALIQGGPGSPHAKAASISQRSVQNHAWAGTTDPKSAVQIVPPASGPAVAHWPPPGLQYPPTPKALLGVPGGTQFCGSLMMATSEPLLASFAPAVLELEELHAMGTTHPRPTARRTIAFFTAPDPSPPGGLERLIALTPSAAVPARSGAMLRAVEQG
jgi:hypothetical protein